MDNLGTLLAHNVWQSIIIFGVVFAILKLIKNTSAEEKSWSWSVTLFALAMLPLAAFLPGKGIELEQAKNVINAAPIEAFKVREEAPAKAIPSKPKKKFMVSSPSKSIWQLLGRNDVLSAFMVIWALGSLIALIRLSYAGCNASRLRQAAYPFAGMDDGGWPENVEIAVSDRVNGPIVIGVFKPLILIPRGFAFDMEQSELRPLLYHELAHVKRCDNLLHFIERVIIAFYWWNPIMHYIAARIAEERELACDDRAVISCGDNLVYAKSLLKGARKLIGSDKPILGLAVLRRESVLSKRIKRLTVSSALEGLDAKRLLKNLSALSMAILVLCLITPRIAVGQGSVNKSELNSVEMHKDGYFLEVEWKGNIEFDDQDTAITELSDDGYFALVTEEGGERKELIMSNDGEAVESRFLENGTEREMNTEDRAWQRNTLVDMLRLSGINAEKRVDRIYKQGGSKAVIDEISQLHSDYATRQYTEALVDIYEVDQDELQRLIIIIGDMESDYEKSLALETIANEQDLDGKTVKLLAGVAPDNADNYDVKIDFEQISEQQGEEIERMKEEILQSIPSDEEIERMRDEALASLPTEAELEEIIADARDSVPSAQELEEIAAAALADFPTDEEFSAMVEVALSDIPTVEELEEMTKEAGKFAPSVDELMAIRKEALESVPSLDELKEMKRQALTDLPTAEELKQIRREAMESIPDKEELKQMRIDAMESLPTKEELQQMREDIKENMLSKEKVEEIRKELKEMKLETQERVPEINSEEITLELYEHIQESIELDMIVVEVARLSSEIAESLSEIDIELSEQYIDR